MFISVSEITEEVARLRREGGQWLKELRERQGLSQKDLAERVNVQFNTFISQLENGKGRIPPERYELWATALGMPPHRFVERLLFYYDPMTHQVLFGDASTGPALTGAGSERRTSAGDDDHVSRIDDLHRLIGKQTAAIEMLREQIAAQQSAGS